MANPKNKQDRKWSLVTYLPPAQIADVFANKADIVRAYAYATHDKDVNEDGTPKATHTHVVVWLKAPYLQSTLVNWFRGRDEKGELVNTMAEPCKNIAAMYRYLTHKDNPDKYQYNDDVVVCSDESQFDDGVQTCDVWQSVSDLLDGVPLREVARTYGRDFIYHYGHIKRLIDDIHAEEDFAERQRQ